MIERTIEHLRVLVSHDTSEPGSVDASHPAVVYVADALREARCTVTVRDLGGGSVNVLGVRGEPCVLFNAHLDTVLANNSWTRDPFTLQVNENRAFGLGACDIKGAAACLLASAESTRDHLAVLFTTDEEWGRGRCVRAASDSMPQSVEIVVVAEPTACAPVVQHRGFASFEVEFAGRAGHSSTEHAGGDSPNALHRAVGWCSDALAQAEPGSALHDARLNIGRIEGGSASNVVAPSARIRLGCRPMPSMENRVQDALTQLRARLGPEDQWTDRMVAPGLSADASVVEAVNRWGMERGPDVDFWTEAALFASEGTPALVLGPGSITQAHAADEFVGIEQLEMCAERYAGIVRADSKVGARHAP